MIIPKDKSVIPSCDVTNLQELEDLVLETNPVEGIGGYKVGITLSVRFGLGNVVRAVRKFSEKPVIYDHQKAGNDIPDLGKPYAQLMKECGVDAAILFPFAGPVTMFAWIDALQEEGVGVIVGGCMTHEGFIESEGGFVNWEGIYPLAYQKGVRDFVVPGTRIGVIAEIKERFPDITLYSPGFVAQGGEISEAAAVAGDRWHSIVGRGIYSQENKRKAAIDLTSQLT